MNECEEEIHVVQTHNASTPLAAISAAVCQNTHSCAQKCVNTVGSFYCQCELGYQPNPLDRNRCEVDTTINPCDLLSSKNITCQHNCRSILEDGQIKSECFCRSGYRLKNDGMNCEDIDECEEKLCSQNCSNLVGNYTCSCYPGYRLIGRQVCEDQICVNSEGSYSCICVNGYEEANGTCTNINECENATLNSCEQKCGDTNGSYVCSCEDGYTQRMAALSVKRTIQRVEQLCINNKGSYSCGCYDGYTLQDDRRKCFRACDEYHWGPECSNACDCFPRGSNSCDPITGCVCKAGWAGEYCDEDKNECSSNTTSLLCPEYSNCINTVGSYFCRYIDECVTTKPCDQECTNTYGGYTCSCTKGFYQMETTVMVKLFVSNALRIL
ncbi:hypothetical protein Btru_069945 [Bulinus truncatus]|nr:hypothetical protein Btru_069945 [Bulinus truncatus]